MEEGDQTDIILLDFAKAFDKVPHDRLLHKMEFYGVRQNTLEWIKQFLTNRTQSLILENHKSDPHQITTTRDIEQVQRWAARFAYNCYQDNSPGCVTNLLNRYRYKFYLKSEYKNIQHKL